MASRLKRNVKISSKTTLATPAELDGSNHINAFDWQTALTALIERKGISGPMANLSARSAHFRR
jgi:hypothetical protein